MDAQKLEWRNPSQKGVARGTAMENDLSRVFDALPASAISSGAPVGSRTRNFLVVVFLELLTGQVPA